MGGMGKVLSNFSELVLGFLKKFTGWFLLMASLSPCPAFSKDIPDLETYRDECLKGVTIYCLSIGLKEQKAGQFNQALEFYRLACETHSTQGHLRACTPFLSLALQMGRLDQAAKKLEVLCQKGDLVLCFYLAKEYFKIGEYRKGQNHLEPLCRKNFRPPHDPGDYGPCYHLGNNYQKTGNLKRAIESFQLDCERNTAQDNPNCHRYEKLKKRTGFRAFFNWKWRKWEPVDFVLTYFILIALTSWMLYEKGGARTLSRLRYGGPSLALLSWFIWEIQNASPMKPRMDLIIICHSVILVVLIGWLAQVKLKTKQMNH